jgi:hypothetical protein
VRQFPSRELWLRFGVSHVGLNAKSSTNQPGGFCMMTRVVPLSRAKALILSVLAIAAAAALLVVTTSGGTAKAGGGRAVTQGDYSVLTSSAAGDASSSAPQSASSGEGNQPIATSLTNIALGNPNITLRIARSTEGGVCVFVERKGARGDGGSCASAALLRTGATAEVHEASGEITIAGVVPDGVSSVNVELAGGGSQTVPVVDNGWAIEDAPASMVTSSDVVGG